MVQEPERADQKEYDRVVNCFKVIIFKEYFLLGKTKRRYVMKEI
jgi:hypothetical protein